MLLIVGLLPVMALSANATEGASSNGPAADKKWTICHFDSNPQQPYGPKPIEVSLNAVDGAGANDHQSHDDPAFVAGAKQIGTAGPWWGDIIPGSDDPKVQPLNYDAYGQAIFENDCQPLDDSAEYSQLCPKDGGTPTVTINVTVGSYGTVRVVDDSGKGVLGNEKSGAYGDVLTFTGEMAAGTKLHVQYLTVTKQGVADWQELKTFTVHACPTQEGTPFGTLSAGSCTGAGTIPVSGTLDANGVDGVTWKVVWDGGEQDVTGDFSFNVDLAQASTFTLQYSTDNGKTWADAEKTDTVQPCPEKVACPEGLIPLDDLSFKVWNGDSWDVYRDAAALSAAWSDRSLANPMSHVVAFYDANNTGGADEVPAGCSRGIQLESYATAGDSWATSGGQQTWWDGDGGTIEPGNASVNLRVSVAPCFYQTDLSSQGATFTESDYFDGHDPAHKLPNHDEGVATPPNLIAATNGGTGCQAPPPPTFDESCLPNGKARVVATFTNPTDTAVEVTFGDKTGTVPAAKNGKSGILRLAVNGAHDDELTASVGSSKYTYTVVADCPKPTLTPTCNADGTGSVTGSYNADLTGGTWALFKDSDGTWSKVDATFDRGTVTATGLANGSVLRLGWVRDGAESPNLVGPTVTIDCPQPIAATGSIDSASCTSTGKFGVRGSYTEAKDAEGNVITHSWRLRYANGTIQSVISPFYAEAPSGVTSGAIELGYLDGDSFHVVATSEATVQDCELPSGTLSTTCGPDHGTVTVGSLDEGTYGESVTWRLVKGDRREVVKDDVESGDVIAAEAGAVYRLQYSLDGEAWSTAGSPLVAKGRCAGPTDQPQGSVDKTAVPATGSTVQPGSTITWTVKVKNTGTAAISEATVVDTLPAHVTVDASTISDGGQLKDGAITWTASLAGGASQTFTYQAKVDSDAPRGADLVNTVTFLGESAATVHTVASGDVALVKAVSVDGGGAAQFGSTLVYTLTANANGTLDQSNVVVTDTVPTGGTYVDGSAKCIGTRCAVAKDGNTLRWLIGDLKAGETRTVTFSVTINTPAAAEDNIIPGVTITNVGAVQSTEVTTPVPSNEVKTTVTAVEGVKLGPKPSNGGNGTPATPSGGGTLPHTGAGLPIGWALLWSTVLVVSGALLLVGGQRMRRRTEVSRASAS